METEFEARKRSAAPPPPERPAGLEAAGAARAKSGYRIADQMAVMEMDEPSFKVNPDLKIEEVD